MKSHMLGRQVIKACRRYGGLPLDASHSCGREP